MIGIISEWFFCLVLTSLTGSLAYVLWKIAECILKRQKKYNWLFASAKLVIIFFIFPIVFLRIYWDTYRYKGVYDDTFMISPIVYNIFKILFLGWLIGFIIEIIKYVNEKSKSNKIKNCNTEVSKYIQKLCDEIKKNSRVRGEISVYYNLYCNIPMVSSIFHPTIYLPAEQMDEETLRVILGHEIVHIKHHDLFWKYLTVWIKRIHWFNPIIYFLNRDIYEWEEAYCDIAMCGVEGKDIGIAAEKYFGVIISNAINKKKKKSLFSIALFEDHKSIKRRMKIVRGYQVSRDLKKWSMVLLSVIFVSMVSLTSYAASEGVLYGYDKIIDATVILEEESPVVENELVEEIIPETDYVGVTEIELPEVSTYAVGQIDTTVAVNSLVKTSAFSCEIGDTIDVTINVTPGIASTRLGIIEPDAVRRAVTSTGRISHAFAVRKDGIHRVYVENLSTGKITVVGYYSTY